MNRNHFTLKVNRLKLWTGNQLKFIALAIMLCLLFHLLGLIDRLSTKKHEDYEGI